MNLSDLKAEHKFINDALIKDRANKDHFLQELDDVQKNIQEYEDSKKTSQEGFIFLKSKAANTRKESLRLIESLITEGLTHIFGQEMYFFFENDEKDIKDKDDDISYKLTPYIKFKKDGIWRIEQPRYSNGGGICEIISLLLKFSFLQYSKYDGPLLFDECLSMVSSDYSKKLVGFIELMVTRFDHQILFISHNAEKFVGISSKNFYVSNPNGEAKVDVMDADDLLLRYYSEAKISKEFE